MWSSVAPVEPDLPKYLAHNGLAMGEAERGSVEHADSVAERMRTMRTLLVAGMCVLSLAAVLALLRGGPNVGSVAFPYVAMLAEHAIAYGLTRKGHLRLAVVVHVTLYLGIVALVMFRFGGIRSPAGFVLPPIVLLAGLTWNGRAALVTAGAAALLTLTLVVLERRGLLPPATGPDAVRLGLVIAATLLITGAILAAALRIIETAKSRALEHERARLHLEERLAQTRTLDTVARIAAGVAHDFNNVLAVILGSADVLKRSSDESTVKWAIAIDDAASVAARLTRQLLSFGRAHSGQVREARYLEVNAVVGDAEALLKRFAGESQLIIELGEDLGVVLADPTQLQQVLLNLVGNASDAMPTPGVVTLRTARASAAQLARVPGWGAGAAGAVALQVIDTGEGMSPDVKARVFEPFFTTKAPGRGSGIGLAAVHGIVEQSGGTILVDSEPRKGSTFTILLPNVAAR
jgi:signal transduction histidine kinase